MWVDGFIQLQHGIKTFNQGDCFFSWSWFDTLIDWTQHWLPDWIKIRKWCTRRPSAEIALFPPTHECLFVKKNDHNWTQRPVSSALVGMYLRRSFQAKKVTNISNELHVRFYTIYIVILAAWKNRRRSSSCAEELRFSVINVPHLYCQHNERYDDSHVPMFHMIICLR